MDRRGKRGNEPCGIQRKRGEKMQHIKRLTVAGHGRVIEAVIDPANVASKLPILHQLKGLLSQILQRQQKGEQGEE